MSTLQLGYVATNTLFTSTALNSLASSATWLVGRACAVQDNRTLKYADVLVNGFVKSNSSATGMVAGICQFWVGGILDDAGSPTYPDTYTGADAGITMTNIEVRNAAYIQLAGFAMNATATSLQYWFPATSLARKFGAMPKLWWLWVVHSNGATLNSSGGGQAYYSPISYAIE